MYISLWVSYERPGVVLIRTLRLIMRPYMKIASRCHHSKHPKTQELHADRDSHQNCHNIVMSSLRELNMSNYKYLQRHEKFYGFKTWGTCAPNHSWRSWQLGWCNKLPAFPQSRKCQGRQSFHWQWAGSQSCLKVTSSDKEKSAKEKSSPDEFGQSFALSE